MCMLQNGKIQIISLATFLLLSFFARGNENTPPLSIVELHQEEEVLLLQHAQILEDVHAELTWPQALASNDWKVIDSPNLKLGMSESAFWFRVQVKYIEAQTRLFQIRYPLLDFVDFYLLQDDVLIKHIETGDSRPFNSRDIKNKNFVISYYQDTDQALTLLIRAKTQGSMIMPLSSVDIERYAHEVSVENITHGIYFGISIAMILYNFMLFVYLKDRSYLYYCLFVFIVLLSALAYTGQGFYRLWPEYEWLNRYMTPVMSAGGYIAATFFIGNFLQLNSRGRWGRRVFLACLAISIISVAASLLLSYTHSVQLLTLIQLLLTVLYLGTSSFLWKSGILEAKYFTFAWVFFIAGNSINAARVLGILPSNDFTIYANLYGNSIEMLMLSMGLAYRFETMKEVQMSLSRELRLAQQNAIENLEKYRHLFQQSPVGLFRYDRSNDTYYHNDKADSLMSQYHGINEFLDESLSVSDYKYLLKHGELSDKILEQGESTYYSLSLLTIKNDDGKVIEIEGTLLDISAQKQAEKHRISTEKEKLNTLTQLVVGISHQFNTPLGVIVTTEDLIKNNLDDILKNINSNNLKKDDLIATLSMTQEAMALSSENIKIMSSILNDLRASIGGRTQLNISMVNVKDFFTALFGYFKAQLKEEGLECSFNLILENNQIDEFYCDHEVMLDIFLRLLFNSYHHAYSSNEIAQNITVNINQDNDFLTIEYRDDGRGLDDTERENMFIPFFTGQTRKKNSSGLGMYILHNQVVKILKGSVDLLTVDKGFAIQIKIPIEYSDYQI